MKQAAPFRDAEGGRIIRRPTQPRSNMARFNRGCLLATQWEEAMEMSSAGRHRVLDEIGPEVLEMFKELLGDSLIKLEKEDAVSGEAPGDLGDCAPIIEPLERTGT